MKSDKVAFATRVASTKQGKVLFATRVAGANVGELLSKFIIVYC